MSEKLMPWDRIDRSRENWEIAKDYLTMKSEKKFEFVTFKAEA